MDELTCQAAVFDDGATRLVVVAADLIGTILGAAIAREVLLGARSLDSSRVLNPSTGVSRTVAVPAGGALIQPAPLRARLTEVPA